MSGSFKAASDQKLNGSAGAVLRAISKYLEKYSPSSLIVGFSGGLDSTVLLHAVSCLRDDFSVDLIAIHVNHGLQQQAKQWEQHCRQFSGSLDIDFCSVSVDVTPTKSESVEQAARRARYQALEHFIKQGDRLLTAHHERDQAETFLLNLMRGSGVSGLSAMPVTKPFADGFHDRPLLKTAYDDLCQYAESFHLTWIEDPSNESTDFDRNLIRLKILPELKKRWPSAEFSISQSASHCAEAQVLLNENAQHILRHIQEAPDAISFNAFKLLTLEQQKNTLRFWVSLFRCLPIPRKKLDEFLKQLKNTHVEAATALLWDRFALRVFKQQVILSYQTDTSVQPKALLTFPFQGRISIEGTPFFLHCQAASHGLRGPVADEKVSVRARQGGERCQPHDRAHSQQLKKLFQEYHVPPWMRDVWPLVYYNDTLVAAAGLWVCKDFYTTNGFHLDFDYRIKKGI